MFHIRTERIAAVSHLVTPHQRVSNIKLKGKKICRSHKEKEKTDAFYTTWLLCCTTRADHRQIKAKRTELLSVLICIRDGGYIRRNPRVLKSA